MRFVPCSIGANHCRLRHLGWEKCSHRPQESASASFLDQLLLLGSLPLRYCSSRFASRTPFWVLPVPGHVIDLLTIEDRAAQVGAAEVARRVSSFGKKRFRLNRKTPAHLVGHCMHARPRV